MFIRERPVVSLNITGDDRQVTGRGREVDAPHVVLGLSSWKKWETAMIWHPCLATMIRWTHSAMIVVWLQLWLWCPLFPWFWWVPDPSLLYLSPCLGIWLHFFIKKFPAAYAWLWMIASCLKICRTFGSTTIYVAPFWFFDVSVLVRTLCYLGLLLWFGKYLGSWHATVYGVEVDMKWHIFLSHFL